MPNKSKAAAAKKSVRPAQAQDHQPGREHRMHPAPEYENPALRGSGRLDGRVALITGGDSGIGRAVALAFAREGAQVAIVYLEEETDARDTAAMVENKGAECLLIRCDITDKAACDSAVATTVERFGRLDVLVNNAAEQHLHGSVAEIGEDELVRTFRTNILAMFFLTAAALPHLKNAAAGASIINTASVTAYRGSAKLLDYSATKGAIVSFTRSLAGQLAAEGIRVNGVAPGPIWTPLIPSTFSAEQVASFGSDSPMGRAGQPWECAECYVFLASAAASYMTGQILHPNGGEIING